MQSLFAPPAALPKSEFPLASLRRSTPPTRQASLPRQNTQSFSRLGNNSLKPTRFNGKLSFGSRWHWRRWSVYLLFRYYPWAAFSWPALLCGLSTAIGYAGLGRCTARKGQSYARSLVAARLACHA